MTAYKIAIDVTVSTGDDYAKADALGEYLCNIIDTVLADSPDDTGYIGMGYGITDAEKEASFTANVSEYGNSLAVNVTRHAAEIGIKKGDAVAVIVRRLA